MMMPTESAKGQITKVIEILETFITHTGVTTKNYGHSYKTKKMKYSFIKMYLAPKPQTGGKTPEAPKPEAAPAPAPAPEAAKPAEPTNEAIEALKAKVLEFKTLSRTFPIDSKEENDALMEAWKAGEDIKKEIANIKKAEAEQKTQEAKAAQIKLLQDVVDTAIANEKAVFNEALSLDEKNAVNDAFKKAFEVVANRLLGGAPRVASTPKEGGATAGTKGSTTAAIRVLIKPMYEAGTDGKEIRRKIIQDEGFNDGTANAVILAYEKEIGLKS